MNYIQLINGFWAADMEYNFTAIETRLYFFLLRICNDLKWKNPFKHSLRQVARGANMSINSVRVAQVRLVESGLIKVTNGIAGDRFKMENKTEYYISTKTSIKIDTHPDTDRGNTSSGTSIKIDTIDKLKENKPKERDFVPPSLEQVIDFFSEKGYTKESAVKAFEYYNVADWKDGKGNPVKNWKQKILSVWLKPENQIKETIFQPAKGMKR